METAISILVIVGAIALILFLIDRSKQRAQISKEGGMTHKYRKLIEIISSARADVKIMDVGPDHVVLGAQSFGGSTIFELIQTFGKLSIIWRSESVSEIYGGGTHKLQWDFDEYMDAEEMMDKINHDVTKYVNNIVTTGYNKIYEEVDKKINNAIENTKKG